MDRNETPAYAVVSPIVGGAIVDTNLIWFGDGRGPYVVHLQFHEDGSVTWKREFYGRHNAELG